MTSSQNLRFVGPAPRDHELDHPAGAFVARLLQSAIRGSGWVVDDVDNWRDCGCSLDCRRAESEVVIAVSELAPSEWMLQIAPRHVTGFLGRLRGRQPSASPGDVFDLAQIVQSTLASDADFSGFRWRWNGFPNDDESTPMPVPWNDA